jgi:hypothetical protein
MFLAPNPPDLPGSCMKIGEKTGQVGVYAGLKRIFL